MSAGQASKGPALAGVVPGAATIGVVLIALRLGGVEPVPAYAVGVVCGLAVTVTVGRRRAGRDAATGLAIVLTLSYSMMVGVLSTFLLAVLGTAP